jgi:N-methylhydantoinase A
VGEIVRQELPGVFCCLSVDVLREIREYERTSTTVINAFLGPTVKGYIGSLVRRLRGAGIAAPVRIMQSSGGIMSAEKAAQNPVQMVESGPAAGVVAGNELGQRMGLRNIITFDMGGTTAKASLIEDGHPSWTTEHEVGAGISLSSRLVKGGGHAVKVPVIDLAEVGAGGGSIIWIDRGGALKVGPRSAGAVPGPVCYAIGGQEPTVTDANVTLGYINPESIAGGAVRLRSDLARAALAESVARPLGLGLLEAAHGVHVVANETMIRAIRAVSTYRGRDPRDFTLLAFGGSGPVHAAGMARSLSIGRVLVPPAPGLFSAVGLLEAQPEYHFVRTFFSRVSDLDLGSLNQAYAGMERQALETLTGEGYRAGDITWRRSVDLRYVGQAYELTVDAPSQRLGAPEIAGLVAGFHDEHERTYGHKAVDEPMEMVNLRITARSTTSDSRPLSLIPTPSHHENTRREAYFGPDYGLLPTPIVTRSDITGQPRRGPFIVEEYDATVVVPPDCSALLDEWHNIVIEIG